MREKSQCIVQVQVCNIGAELSLTYLVKGQKYDLRYPQKIQSKFRSNHKSWPTVKPRSMAQKQRETLVKQSQEITKKLGLQNQSRVQSNREEQTKVNVDQTKVKKLVNTKWIFFFFSSHMWTKLLLLVKWDVMDGCQMRSIECQFIHVLGGGFWPWGQTLSMSGVDLCKWD